MQRSFISEVAFELSTNEMLLFCHQIFLLKRESETASGTTVQRKEGAFTLIYAKPSPMEDFSFPKSL
jgi:hypothetical protein